MTLELLADMLRVGLGEDGADRGGDHLAVALGHLASTLRRKWTRQRCQAAPSRTAAIAAFSPAWASEMTSWTPPSPRAFRPRRNAVQNAPSSVSPTAKPEHLTAAVGADPGRDHHGLGDHPDPAVRSPPTRALQ